MTLSSSFFAALFTSQNIAFPLIGYYIERKMDSRWFCGKSVAISSILGIVAIFASMYMTKYRLSVTGEIYAETSHNGLILLPAAATYIGFKTLFQKIQIKNGLRALIMNMGGCTFGIYLLEMVLRNETAPIYTFLQHHLSHFPMLSCLFWIAACEIIGFIVVYFFKNIGHLTGILHSSSERLSSTKPSESVACEVAPPSTDSNKIPQEAYIANLEFWTNSSDASPSE